MSSNPQWKSFQPPTLNDTSIIDFKPMSIHSNGTSSSYRSPGIGYPSSNIYQNDAMKDMANNLFSSQSNFSNYNVYSNNSSSSARYLYCFFKFLVRSIWMYCFSCYFWKLFIWLIFLLLNILSWDFHSVYSFKILLNITFFVVIVP